MDPLFLPLLLIAVLALLSIMNFRRQKRASADARQLQSSLVDGDRVVTISGLHATVVDSAREETVDLEIAPGVRTRWVRAAIREKLTEREPLTGHHDDPDAIDAAPLDGSARADKS
ncbi:MAG: preprotein translocase subunit YajC [Pseudonocardiaceae bacterium]